MQLVEKNIIQAIARFTILVDGDMLLSWTVYS